MTKRKRKSSKSLGNDFEAQAVQELQQLGWSILSRQYYTPYGELDIVAIRSSLLWFIEVKGSTQQISYDIVTSYKRQCLLKSIEYWLQHHDIDFEDMELVFTFRSSEGLDWIVDSCE